MPTLKRLLTSNCHEAWVWQLGYLGLPLDVIDGLPGRYCTRWDTRMRPVPPGARLIRLDEALRSRNTYECIIVHNITDLLDLKSLPGPRIFVAHETLEGRILQHGINMTPDQLRLLWRHYLELLGGHAVAVSPLKARSWGFVEDVVENCVDAGSYLHWSGTEPAGLRICNQVNKRKQILLWDFHEAAFSGVPVRLVGVNHDFPGTAPSESWDGLKRILSSHRFFIHTAHPELEDGYNLAVLEAMAAGLPILGNRHPTSPVKHGISGFLSDDPAELRRMALLLLQDKDLAGRMGEAARKEVAGRFPVERFVTSMEQSIGRAQEKWKRRRMSDDYFSLTFSEDENLQVLIRGGLFLRLGDEFLKHVRSMEIEEAISVLDEVMKLLEMERDRSIEGFGDLIKILLEVSDRLGVIRERRAAQSILQAALMLESISAFRTEETTQ